MEPSLDYYKSIPGWFSDQQAESLDRIIRQHGIRSVIEIGSFIGRSAAFFAARVDTVIAIDTFRMWPEGRGNGDTLRWTEGQEDFYDLFKRNTQPFAEKIVIIRGKSEAVEMDHPELTADLIYIDAAHDYVSVASDIRAWRMHANKILAGDDYTGPWPDVKKAVDEILGKVDLEPNCPLWYKVI